MDGIENIINFITTFYGDRWLLDLLWWSILNVHKCWNLLYTLNEYNIFYQLQFLKE